MLTDQSVGTPANSAATSLLTHNQPVPKHMISNGFSSLQGGKTRFPPRSRENRALSRAAECRLVRSTIRGEDLMDDSSPRQAGASGNEIDRPVPSAPSNRVWGSDAIAAMLRELDIPYVALNPGASYRGIHDSLVNYLGNTRPRMLLCLHEESAVALAHGYAKVTGRPMAAFVHSNVGLMHATMAIFNAWCDRTPVLVLGATGPMDSTRRRPWIEWIHTARDQGALIRNFTKWDDQPASIGAAQEAILRAWLIANTAPQGPVYVTS